MEKSIFESAREYDFEAIRKYRDGGNSINICDKNGNSLFADFLTGYCNYGDGDTIDDREALLEIHEEDDYDFWDSYLSEKLKTPLKERQDGVIIEQMDWFLANGADINLCDLSKTGMVKTPIAVAVCNEDYYLAEYLLEHGADPKVWLFSDFRPWLTYETWLMEDIDIKMMDSKGEQFQNLLHIAALLAHYGMDDFGGICISIDKETRTIEGHGPQYKF